MLPYDTKKAAAIFPLTAMKMTIENYSKFNLNKYPLTFDNWHERLENWSMKDAFNQHVFNIIFYMIFGLIFDVIVNFNQYFTKFCRMRSVVFENTNKGLIEIVKL